MNFTLPSKWYNAIKFLVTVVIPALITFIAVLGPIWDWDNITKITATLAAIAALLGTLIGISSRNYNSDESRFVGETWLAPTDEGWKRVFDVQAEEIDPDRSELTFKVVNNQTP